MGDEGFGNLPENQPPPPAGVVDRIEGDFAVIEVADTGDFEDVELALLPPGIKEGDRWDGEKIVKPPPPAGVVDRIEGDFAVIEVADTGAFEDVELSRLPPGIKEGDRWDGEKIVGPD